MSKSIWDIIIPGIMVFLCDKFIYDLWMWSYEHQYYCINSTINGFSSTKFCQFDFNPMPAVLVTLLFIIITYYYLKNSYNTLEAIGREHYFNRK